MRKQSGKPPGAENARGRAWRYGPLLLWVGFIFLASTGGFSAPNTSRVIGPLLAWLLPGVTEAGLLRAHLLIRKAAHFAEYAVLALLAARAFASSSKVSLRRLWASASFALVVACALADEYHQSFVAARTGTIYDSLLDVSGGATALALVAWRRNARGPKISAASGER